MGGVLAFTLLGYVPERSLAAVVGIKTLHVLAFRQAAIGLENLDVVIFGVLGAVSAVADVDRARITVPACIPRAVVGLEL